MKEVKNAGCDCKQQTTSVGRGGNIEATSQEPKYIPDGFFYFDGSIASKNYRIIDGKGNKFTWIPETILSDGRVVNGFYVSTYEISEGDDFSAMSVEGKIPWVNINQDEAFKVAKEFGGNLISGEQYDAICEILASEVGNEKVYKNSTEIGNYRNSTNSHRQLEYTGGYEICGISNFAGNCWIWTTEETKEGLVALRGGSYLNRGIYRPIASRYNEKRSNSHSDVGFRIVL